MTIQYGMVIFITPALTTDHNMMLVFDCILPMSTQELMSKVMSFHSKISMHLVQLSGKW